MAILTLTAIAIAWYAAFAYEQAQATREAATGTQRSAEAAEAHAEYVARQVRGSDVANLHRLRDLLASAQSRLDIFDQSLFDLMRRSRVTRGKALLNEERLDGIRAIAYTLGGSVGETVLQAVISLEAAHRSYGEWHKAITENGGSDLAKLVAGVQACVEVANEDVQRAMAAVLLEIDVLAAKLDLGGGSEPL